MTVLLVASNNWETEPIPWSGDLTKKGSPAESERSLGQEVSGDILDQRLDCRTAIREIPETDDHHDPGSTWWKRLLPRVL